jgi:hypothetical protein
MRGYARETGRGIMATSKGSKTVDGTATKAESAAWLRFNKQAVMPFLTADERAEDAFRTAYRIARDVEVKKAERLAQRQASKK